MCPKICVNTIIGANRAILIQGGSRGIRLPPCEQHNACGAGCQGRRSRLIMGLSSISIREWQCFDRMKYTVFLQMRRLIGFPISHTPTDKYLHPWQPAYGRPFLSAHLCRFTSASSRLTTSGISLSVKVRQLFSSHLAVTNRLPFQRGFTATTVSI